MKGLGQLEWYQQKKAPEYYSRTFTLFINFLAPHQSIHLNE
jgi:hypothetical protein